MQIRLFPCPAPLRREGEQMEAAERARLRAAALHARRLYPGALGLLASRELTALADFGFRFDRDALVPRLATAVLTSAEQQPAPHAEPAQSSHTGSR